MGPQRMAAPSLMVCVPNMPDWGACRPLRRLLAASISLTPPRRSSSCTTTCFFHIRSTSAAVKSPPQEMMVSATSRANSVSSVLQLSPLWKSVVKP